MVQTLLERDAEANIQDKDGRSPLMHSCHIGNEDLVTLFLEYEADASLKDVKGLTFVS